MVKRTYLGTSGWYYRDWVGPVYSRDKYEKEWLYYYSRIFNFTNVNMTYYQEKVSSELVRRWYRETPPNFRFVIKANQKFVHKRSFNPQEFAQWTKQFDYLLEKRLGFLLQFPQSIRRSKQLISEVQQIELDIPFFVEFRDKSWYYPPPNIDPAILVIPDTPRISTLPGRATSTRLPNNDVLFIRLHGRNRYNWYEHKEARERYDYYYPPSEIRYIVQKMASQKSIIIIDANNHPLGQAPLNIVDAKRVMGKKISGSIKELEKRITSILSSRLHREKMSQLAAYFRTTSKNWETVLETELKAEIRVATPYIIVGTSEGVEVYIDRCEKKMSCEKPKHKGIFCEHLQALLKTTGGENPQIILEDYITMIE